MECGFVLQGPVRGLKAHSYGRIYTLERWRLGLLQAGSGVLAQPSPAAGRGTVQKPAPHPRPSRAPAMASWFFMSEVLVFPSLSLWAGLHSTWLLPHFLAA